MSQMPSDMVDVGSGDMLPYGTNVLLELNLMWVKCYVRNMHGRLLQVFHLPDSYLLVTANRMSEILDAVTAEIWIYDILSIYKLYIWSLSHISQDPMSSIFSLFLFKSCSNCQIFPRRPAPPRFPRRQRPCR